MKKETQAISAQKLRWVLVGTIVSGVILGVAGVWYLNGLLVTRVAATNDASQSSSVSKNNLELAQGLKSYLQNHTDDVQKAAMVVAQTTAYRYQNQIVEDVTRYANAAGVTIVGFDFPQDISSATVDKTTGLKSLTATITLSDHAAYTSYLLFLKYIEQNLTKMQITDVTISPNLADQNYINNTSVGIQVYVE
jgi:hypothetical protein